MSNNQTPQYENNEIFTFANRSVLIGFNSLMKNLFIEKDYNQRKDLSKKNKIQISYVDLKSKGTNGKRVKHDFFVDIEDMKYFVDMVYESLINPSSAGGNQVRKHGLKIMGGHKHPQVISNIFTFNFLTTEEYKNSSPNQKVLSKYEQDKQKYNNAMLDWKNIQVAKLQFDKKVGRILNGGLIIPTGQKVENANFKPYYISQQELLEFCVTMRDFINRTETIFLIEAKLSDFEQRIINAINQNKPNNQMVNQAPNQMQQNQQSQISDITQINTVGGTGNSSPQKTSQRSPEEKKKAMENELHSLLSNAREVFVNSFKNQTMASFLDCLVIDTLNFQNNVMSVTFKFNSELYKIKDFQNERNFFNTYYERCLKKQVELDSKKYDISVNPLP